MSFGTVINCIDGRVQLPVNEYLQKKYGIKYIDTITAAGPNGILAKRQNTSIIENMFFRVGISVDLHGSTTLAVVGHHDCAGNPVPRDKHLSDIKDSVEYLIERFPDLEIIGLWVDDNWEVSEVA